MADPGGYYRIDPNEGGPSDPRPPWFLCEVCYKTFAGVVCRYPKQYDTGVHMAVKVMAQCTNLLLRRIEKLERSRE